MAFITALLPMSQMAVETTVSVTIGSFISNVFLHPGEHFYALIILGVGVVAGAVGIAFLVKKVYDKYCPEPKIN